MANIQVAQVQDDTIVNVAEFDEDTYEAVIAEWTTLGLIPPGMTHIKMSDLPEGAALGWIRVDDVWQAPPEPEPQEE